MLFLLRHVPVVDEGGAFLSIILILPKDCGQDSRGWNRSLLLKRFQTASMLALVLNTSLRLPSLETCRKASTP